MLLSGAVTLTALILGLLYLDLRSLLAVLGRASPGWLAAAVLAYSMTLTVSAVRIRLFAGDPAARRTGIPRLLGVEYLSTAAAYLLPMALGELVRAALWKARTGIGLARLGFALLLLRAVDVVWLWIAILMAWRSGLLGCSPWIDRLVVLVSLPAIGLCLFLLWLGWQGRQFWESATARSARWLERVRRGWGAALQQKAREAGQLNLPPGGTLKRGLLLVGLATLYWSSDWLFFYSVARSVLPQIAPSQMIAVFLLACALAMTPFRGVADVGTHELAWTVPLVLVGYPRDSAVTLAAASHVVLLGVIVSLSLAGAVIAHLPGDPPAAAAPGPASGPAA